MLSCSCTTVKPFPARPLIFEGSALIRNPTILTYEAELVRLPLQIPPDALQSLCLRAMPSGSPLPSQVYEARGDVWVFVSLLAPTAVLNLSVTSPAGADCVPAPPAATAASATTRPDGALVLSNGLADVALSWLGAPRATPPPPFLSLMHSTTAPLGTSAWNLTSQLAARWSGNFSCTLLAAGPLYVEAQLLYGFSDGGSSQWSVRLAVGQRGAQVTETHDSLDVDAAVDLSLHSGAWQPKFAVSNGWAYCDTDTPTNPSGMNATTAQQWAPLAPQGRLPSGSLGMLVARWSQSCDAKFFWGVTDAADSASDGTLLGVLGVRGGEWLWPQYRSQSYDTQRWHLMGPWSSSAGQGSMHLPLHGRRVWYLLSGPVNETATPIWSLVQRYAMAELDRLINTYDLDWPGAVLPNATVNTSAFHFYSPDTDPTHTVRAQGKALLLSLTNASTAPAAGLDAAASANFYCDPDWWGAYVGFSSPENPNFWTDWSKLCIGWSMALALRQHPRASAYCNLARSVWDFDLLHSVALPSGAGQESPGYTAHALSSWVVEAPLLDAICPNATHPAAAHPRLLSSLAFLLRTSQPWAYHFLGSAAANNTDLLGGRFVLPLGDTHPTSTNFSAFAEALPQALALLPPVTEWGSEELAGFGALLQSGAGGERETFFAMKASPSRGHNHGDQLSFHYAAYGARIVIDVMAGYLPRPPQEFWHNRACFGNDTNIDGAERLLGFVSTPLPDGGSVPATIVVGEVLSQRLQSMPPRPPPNYLQVFPTFNLAAPLTYRRSALLLPAPPSEPGARDIIVLVDTHNASELAVTAYTSLLFFQQDGMVAAPVDGLGHGGVGFDMGNGTVFTFAQGAGGAAVALMSSLDRWDWASEGNENATRLIVKPVAALDAGGATTFFVTALYPDGTAMSSEPSTPSFDFAGGALTITWRGGARDVLTFSGALTDASVSSGAGGAHAVAVLERDGSPSVTLMTADDLSSSRSQGDIGLNVLDAGYTFGEIPAQVIEERGGDTSPPPAYPWPIPH